MIIGLSGWARSGKDTVANHLVKNHGFVKMAFADPMKEALYRLNPRLDLPGLPGVALAWAVDNAGWEVLKDESPEVRGLLQRMGTEVGRSMFGEDFWVDYAIGKSWAHDNVVFSDVRFRNEASAIQKNWGHNWRVTRPGVQAVNDHISEHDLDHYTFDAHLENEGSVELLLSQVDKLLGEI